MSADPASQEPKLLRRLLRAKDRMDAASTRLAGRAAGAGQRRLQAHFARSFKQAFGAHRTATFLRGASSGPRRCCATPNCPSRTSPCDRLGSLGTSAASSATSPAKPGCAAPRAGPARVSSARCPPASSAPRSGPTSHRSFGEAAADGGRYKRLPIRGESHEPEVLKSSACTFGIRTKHSRSTSTNSVSASTPTCATATTAG